MVGKLTGLVVTQVTILEVPRKLWLVEQDLIPECMMLQERSVVKYSE